LQAGLVAQPGHAQRQLLGAGAQLQRQPLVLLLQPPQIAGALQRQDQVVGPPGLEQVLPEAGLVDAGDLDGLAARRSDDRPGHAAIRFRSGARHRLTKECKLLSPDVQDADQPTIMNV